MQRKKGLHAIIKSYAYLRRQQESQERDTRDMLYVRAGPMRRSSRH